MKSVAGGILLAASLVVSMATAELLTRAWFGSPNPLPVDPHGERTLTLRPSSKGSFPVQISESRQTMVPYHTSSIGLRDREYSDKASGEIRVALLGDSMTMGWGLGDHETISSRLEALLNRERDGRISVINAGQFGYGPTQLLSLLTEKVLPLEPDVVVLQVFMGNDLADSARSAGFRLRTYNKRAELEAELAARDKIPCYRASRWLREKSGVYQLIASALGRAAPICFGKTLRAGMSPIRIEPPEERPHWLESNLREWYPELNRAWDLASSSIGRIHRLCEAHGIEFFVYSLPSLTDVSEARFREATRAASPNRYRFRKALQLSENLFADSDFNWIDVPMALLAPLDPAGSFLPWDGHLTEIGARRTAQALAAYLDRHSGTLSTSPRIRTGQESPADADRAADQIVVVTLDTLRADHLSAYGYRRDTSPFLDLIARRGSVFYRAVAQSSVTLPSHATIFTGLYPRQHGVRTNVQVLSSRIVTLAEVLQADGFTTLASVSTRHLASGGLERGFDIFLAPRLGDLRAYRPAEETVAVALDEIERGSVAKRAFYWFHFFDPHIPYRRHGELHYSGESDSEEFEAQVRFLVNRHRAHEDIYDNVWGLVSAIDQYDDEVRYADTQLSRLYFAFERMGLNDNSLWIFTSDHGEGLSNHELRGHERHIYNEQVRIPLIIYDRGRNSRPRAHQRLVEQVDLLPTVLDFAGVSTSRVSHREFLAGESLRDLVVRGKHAAAPKLAFSESGTRSGGKNQPLAVAVQDSSYKYIRWADGRAELFDVESDPYEESDLLQGTGADSVASSLAKSIVKWEAAPAVRTTGRQRDVDPALHEQLRKLGYIE